ncbi:MAG: galactokinase [Anaerolineae bacterium]
MRLRSAEHLPEVRQFITDLASHFDDIFDADADIYVTRAPARLDVMGGIADYSGSVVLEGTLDRAIVVGLQRRADRRLVVRSLGIEREGLVRQVELNLDSFFANGGLKPYADVRQELQRDPVRHWSAYVSGAFYVLMREGAAPAFRQGATIGLTSTIPLGAGISSSAALEVATMTAILVAFGLQLDGLELARLCQMVENHVVGAPCGIMDQVTSALGQAGQLLALRCQPHDILGQVTIPAGFRVLGIDSDVRHAVGGSRYTDTRVSAFMGHKIILHRLQAASADDDPTDGYLCRLSPEEYTRRFRDLLPLRISGRQFLDTYGPTVDPVTQVDPNKVYRVRSRTEHPIYENHRVQRFIECLEQAQIGESELSMREAGRLMYASHWSYGKRCGLGAPETDLLVRLVRERGPEEGLYGAKITGGGSGGTVAVLAADGTDDVIQTIAQTYQGQTGLVPDLFLGTSPGALAYGYDFVRLR